MAYFWLSRGQARYYLIARNGFHVSSSVLVLSIDEIELVEILRGILSVSRGVKDMNEAWFAKAGLSPAIRDMFFPVAAKQPMDASGSIARISADKGQGMVELEEVPERGYTMQESCKVEDRVGVDKYFTSIMTQLKCVDSKDPLVPRWSTISGSSPLWTEGPLYGEYLWGALHPTLAKQVYEYSSEELMNWADKSAIWVRNISFLHHLFSFQTLTPFYLQGLHFVSALIDRVHDVGRLVQSQHEKILTLRAANKELEVGVDQELIAAVEQRAKLLRANLDGAHVEGDVFSMTEAVAFLEAELKTEGQKVVAAYKASRGFKSGLEKMGRVSYEFGYWVALEQLRGKHLDIKIKWDPLECSKYANVEMDLDQPFDDGTPFEKQLTL
ncbi:hypothetical protein B296_00029420 [Ensete ventricosum]|uniref:Uncharacterized protein n=1 Tax=Ensete ventricosum TaxID=4639 RepID=A0A426Y783_ENSVE|nr:hypothetical protein B296_00029420 [Ensete ventricosum]